MFPSPSEYPAASPPRRGAAVAIVGAGPKGIGVLERLCASAAELLGDRPVTAHLIDPHPPGAGRVWRHDQSPLLLMNSRAGDVTMFTDDSVRCAGPIRPGPTLAEWVAQARERETDPGLRAEMRAATPVTFHSRRLQGAYLRWFYRHVAETRPASVDIRVHRTEAVDLTESADGDQLVWLRDTPEPIRADVVVLTVGHLDAETDDAAAALASFAHRHGRGYLPPTYTADAELSAIEPGEPVLVRGFGLAFIDLMALLTEGRGGRYEPAADDALVYRPSGAEPVLLIGSRRGVPYRPKPGYALRGTPAALPRFFGTEQIAALAARPGPIRFRADLWPLIGKELGWGHYTELFTAHPERVRMEFAEFGAHYAEFDWDSAESRALIAAAVPAAADRFDPHALDRPLAGPPTDRPGTAARVRTHIEETLARCADPAFSADLGAITAMLSVFRHLPQVVATGKLDPRSQLAEVDGWWFGFFSYLGSGPPRQRLVELLALERAGIVTFVGPDMWVGTDESRGVFVGGSRGVPGAFTATTLVDARLPDPDVARTTNPIVRALHDRGDLGEEVLTGAATRCRTGRIHTSGLEGRLYDARRTAHPRRFAMGPHTSLRIAGAFSRPRTNALGFRENDSVARQVLHLLAELAAPVPTPNKEH